MPRPLLISFAVAAAAICTAGILLGGVGFINNLVAEIVGIPASVVIAVALVDRMSTKRRQQEWRTIRLVTTRSIGRHLSDIFFSASTLLLLIPYDDVIPQPATLGDDLRLVADKIGSDHDKLSEPRTVVLRDPTDPDASFGYGERISTTEHRNGVIYVSDENARSSEVLRELNKCSSRELYKGIRGDFSYLTDVLTPRVLQLGDDVKLGELLIQLQDRERDWAGTIDMVDGWGLPEHYAWSAAEGFFRAAASTADYIDEISDKGDA
jgi:hypothetical protein